MWASSCSIRKVASLARRRRSCVLTGMGPASWIHFSGSRNQLGSTGSRVSGSTFLSGGKQSGPAQSWLSPQHRRGAGSREPSRAGRRAGSRTGRGQRGRAGGRRRRSRRRPGPNCPGPRPSRCDTPSAQAGRCRARSALEWWPRAALMRRPPADCCGRWRRAGRSDRPQGRGVRPLSVLQTGSGLPARRRPG